MECFLVELAFLYSHHKYNLQVIEQMTYINTDIAIKQSIYYTVNAK